MDIKDYRRKLEQSVAKVQAGRLKAARGVKAVRGRKAASPARTEDPRSIVDNKKTAAKTRAEALGRVTQAEGPDVVPETALECLADPKESPVVRLAAIKLLQQKQIFSSVAAEWRPAFVEGLRAAVREPRVRAAALEVLALFKDRPTQEQLLEGIRKPKRALVPRHEALRLLSTDVHADVVDEARKLTNTREMRKDKKAFHQAVRILAADPGSVDKLEEVLENNAYPIDSRRLAATGISHLSPEVLERPQPAPTATRAKSAKKAKSAKGGRRGVKRAAKSVATPTGALAKHLETLKKIRG